MKRLVSPGSAPESCKAASDIRGLRGKWRLLHCAVYECVHVSARVVYVCSHQLEPGHECRTNWKKVEKQRQRSEKEGGSTGTWLQIVMHHSHSFDVEDIRSGSFT